MGRHVVVPVATSHLLLGCNHRHDHLLYSTRPGRTKTRIDLMLDNYIQPGKVVLQNSMIAACLRVLKMGAICCRVIVKDVSP